MDNVKVLEISVVLKRHPMLVCYFTAKKVLEKPVPLMNFKAKIWLYSVNLFPTKNS